MLFALKIDPQIYWMWRYEGGPIWWSHWQIFLSQRPKTEDVMLFISVTDKYVGMFPFFQEIH